MTWWSFLFSSRASHGTAICLAWGAQICAPLLQRRSPSPGRDSWPLSTVVKPWISGLFTLTHGQMSKPMYFHGLRTKKGRTLPFCWALISVLGSSHILFHFIFRTTLGCENTSRSHLTDEEDSEAEHLVTRRFRNSNLGLVDSEALCTDPWGILQII